MYDFIIVGGGIAGLELGAMLSHDGYKLLVLEQSEHVGGRAFVYIKNGFVLDNGIHLVRFGRKSAIANVIKRIGGNIEFASLGDSYFVDEHNKFILFPTGPAGFLKSELFSFKERLKALGIMIKLKIRKRYNLKKYSVEDWMHNEGIKNGLERYFRLVSASMLVCPITSVASAEALTQNINMVLKTGVSVEYPVHGWQKDIIEPLTAAIKRHGEIKTGVRVNSVVIEDGKATGIKIKEETINGENIIIDIPSQELEKVLDIKDINDEKLKLALNLVPTSGISIDYAIEGKISDLNGLIYFEDPISFGCFISNIAPDTAPKGKSLLTWFCPIQHEEMRLKDQIENYRQRLENKIEAVFPQLKIKTIFKRTMHLNMVDGVELNINQLQEKRLNYAINGIKNLYLAGDTTAAPGAGGDIAHESSIECYKKITGKAV